MARFQFSLQRLLELRRLELRQIEACAAREAELAEAARRHRQAHVPGAHDTDGANRHQGATSW